MTYEEQLLEYKNELMKLLDKSTDAFEKQLNYISAGAIGISMVLIEKIVQDIHSANYKWLLIVSWCLFLLTLVGNLISHLYTYEAHSKTIGDIVSKTYDHKIAKSRNDKVKIWNVFSIVFLILGIISLIIFTSINL